MLIPLAHSGTLRVQEFHCDGRSTVADERNVRHEIIFVRRGGFRVESERGRELVDSQRVLLIHRGEQFRVTHPSGCGDRCLILGLDETLLGESLEASPAIAGRRPRHPEAPFPALTLACPPELHHAAVGLGERLREEQGDPLIAAEGLLGLLRRTLGGVGRREPTARPSPAGPDRDLEESVRLELLRHLGERLPLDRLAAAVGVSQYHLARRFRRQTGSSIHQYRLELRLREAHARLLEGERDLTRLALELGFSDHAHFSNAFRRRFGKSPSLVRERRVRRATVLGRRAAPGAVRRGGDRKP